MAARDCLSQSEHINQVPLSFWLASGFGLGLCKAPGTMGSLLAFPVMMVLSFLPGEVFIFAFLMVSVLLTIVTLYAYHWLGGYDHKSIISDEVMGMMLALLFFPVSLFHYSVLFALFRFYDIFKPLIIGVIDSSDLNGYEVILDDLAASLYT